MPPKDVPSTLVSLEISLKSQCLMRRDKKPPRSKADRKEKNAANRHKDMYKAGHMKDLTTKYDQHKNLNRGAALKVVLDHLTARKKVRYVNKQMGQKMKKVYQLDGAFQKCGLYSPSQIKRFESKSKNIKVSHKIKAVAARSKRHNSETQPRK